MRVRRNAREDQGDWLRCPNSSTSFRPRGPQQIRCASNASQKSFPMQLPVLVHFRDAESAGLLHRNEDQNLLPKVQDSSQHIHCANLADHHPMVQTTQVRLVLKISTTRNPQDFSCCSHPILLGRHRRSACHQDFDVRVVRNREQTSH